MKYLWLKGWLQPPQGANYKVAIWLGDRVAWNSGPTTYHYPLFGGRTVDFGEYGPLHEAGTAMI